MTSTKKRANSETRLLLLNWLASERPKSGHWYSFPLSLHRARCPDGVAIACLSTGPRYLSKVLPTWTYSIQGGLQIAPLKRLLPKQIELIPEFSSATHVSVYEGNLRHLYVFLALASRFPSKTFHVNLFDPTEMLRRLESVSEVSKHKISHLVAGIQNIRVTVENEAMQAELRRHLGIQVPISPLFSALEPPNSGPDTLKRERVTINLGPGITDADLQSLIEILQPKWNSITVVQPPKAGKSTAKVGIRSSNVDFVSGYLSDEEYSKLLRQSLVWIFLYHPVKYQLKSSGRVEDCLLFGVTPITASNSSLRSQWASDGDFPMETEFDWGDWESLANVIDKVASSKVPLPEGRSAGSYLSFLTRIPKTQRGCDCNNHSEQAANLLWDLGRPKRYNGWRNSLGGVLVQLALRRP